MNRKISIGIRASPSVIYYSIIEEKEDKTFEFLVLDKVIVPIALQLPEQLKFIRNTFLDIISEFQVNKACIRVTESMAQTTNSKRISIEAVIQELFASSTVQRYYVGQISNISAKLSIPRDELIPLIEGKQKYKDIDDWNAYSKEIRESILSSFSALNL
jgi:hypothetical protein